MQKSKGATTDVSLFSVKLDDQIIILENVEGLKGRPEVILTLDG